VFFSVAFVSSRRISFSDALPRWEFECKLSSNFRSSASAAADVIADPTVKLIALDEVGYVPLADIGVEFLFQVISERAERAAIIVTTNLPFSEWTTVFPNPRLCKALLDRITDRAHIIETGTESFRFRRTVERRKKP
jgi:DNA replication protein DnaC